MLVNQVARTMSSFTEDDMIELELLRDQEIDALVHQGFISTDEQWNPKLRNGLVFHYSELDVEITTGHPYPAGPLEYQVKNKSMPRIIVDKLRIDLRETIEYDSNANSFEKWVSRGSFNNYGCFEFEMSVLHIAVKTAEHLAEFRNSQNAANTPKESKKPNQDGGIDLSTIQGHESVTSLLGKTPEEICAGLPEYFRVLHIESVIRGDLYKDFLFQQREIREQLLEYPLSHLRKSAPIDLRHSLRNRADEKELTVDNLVTPHLTFHGTRRDLVSSIVRHGFLLPGDTIPFSNEKNQVRCGSTYGRGIYSSPSASFSLSYSGYGAFATQPNEYDGLKLIVCATIMGVSARLSYFDNWRQQSKPFPGATSHVDPTQFEYIVFNRAQILPCYVIHLDWGRDNARFFENIPANAQAWVSRQEKHVQKKLNPQFLGPGDIQRQNQALTSKAAKWFPYGYGPATGTSFVIEAVGDVDDDEEEYGVYQKDRLDEIKEGVDGGGNVWRWNAIPEDGDKQMDEYYDSRRAKSKRPIRKLDDDDDPDYAK